MNKTDIISKIHLIISVLIVVPTAILYGFNANLFLEIHLETIDELNAFKAISGLYLGFSVLWLLGIRHKNFLKPALISNVVFMLGLGVGRVASIIIDGLPTLLYTLGILGELILGFYGIWILNQKYLKKP